MHGKCRVGILFSLCLKQNFICKEIVLKELAFSEWGFVQQVDEIDPSDNFSVRTLFLKVPLSLCHTYRVGLTAGCMDK